MHEYEVALSMRFSAESDVDALRQMVAYVAGYRVTALENGAEWFADAEYFFAEIDGTA